jgi:peptide/nickel transport system ATP-binding protein
MSLDVANLRVAYRTLTGDVVPVDDVSFAVADGEIMGLAGESGSGKSTLGNSLIHLDARMRHLGGHVELDGQRLPIADTKAMRPYRMKEVSLVPQYALSALNPTRKIRRLAADLLRCHGVRYREVEAEMKRRIALVGLGESVLDSYPFELSGGMRQRVTLVLSTLLNPSLLIADEITSALDVSTQRAVGELLLEFTERGFVKSLIMITHDLSVLAQIADSILVMYAGRLAEKAGTSAIVNAPMHPYTQLLLASLPEVGVRHDQATLTGIPGRPPPLSNPPAGCRFAERCPFAYARCAEQPPFEEVRPGHYVACWKVTEASRGADAQASARQVTGEPAR